LIDEIRLYEDGAYDDGPAAAGSLPAAKFRNLAFIDAVLGKTHKIERQTRRGGYLMALPLATSPR
jgi:hypothetical protein